MRLRLYWAMGADRHILANCDFYNTAAALPWRIGCSYHCRIPHCQDCTPHSCLGHVLHVVTLAKSCCVAGSIKYSLMYSDANWVYSSWTEEHAPCSHGKYCCEYKQQFMECQLVKSVMRVHCVIHHKSVSNITCFRKMRNGVHLMMY